MNLHFIPLNKYDCVIEHFDGSITIPPHEKKRYLFSFNSEKDIYLLNNIDGCVYKYNLEESSLIQINSNNPDFWKDKIGISLYNENFVTYDKLKHEFIFLNKASFTLSHTQKIDLIFNNFTIFGHHIWAINIENNIVYQIDIESNSILRSFHYKGIGNASIAINNNLIYISDSDENLLKVFDLNGKLQFEAITPFIDPIGQIFYNNSHFILYSGLVNEVGYDNHCWQEQKPFFHELKIQNEIHSNYIITFTNAFEVDFFYEEYFDEDVDKLNSTLPITLDLAIPPDTIHQKVMEVSPLGLHFEIIEREKIKYARFIIYNPHIKAIGYKAKLILKSVKYNFLNEDEVQLSNEDLLSDAEKKDLDIDDPYFNQFIINDKFSDIQKVKVLRNQIYSKLYYKKNTKASSFAEVLKDGYGTCGDYTSLMMILFNKNSISCQSAGGYKIPRFYNATSGIISVYYNHAWIEIFNNKNEPIPVESSSDDKEYKGRFSEGQFFGIDWTHIKLYNGKAYPHLINIPSHPDLHPFDLLKKAGIFVIIKKEL